MCIHYTMPTLQLNGGFKEGLGLALEKYDTDQGKAEALDGLQHTVGTCVDVSRQKGI